MKEMWKTVFFFLFALTTERIGAIVREMNFVAVTFWNEHQQQKEPFVWLSFSLLVATMGPITSQRKNDTWVHHCTEFRPIMTPLSPVGPQNTFSSIVITSYTTLYFNTIIRHVTLGIRRGSTLLHIQAKSTLLALNLRVINHFFRYVLTAAD